ncbi:type II protein arginine methyltransferase [Malassezia vespertilionis]|uniref:Skb1p n=1 Tax=Malassezia vespertilionis TaxID=2020962 RepID=A0A2N1JCH7_9BASI|nr:type II protein arginine methyltransferase [Malassezia vespertilionis]PKI84260.1 Skb1p [Malassezia vespertilionis]WFD06165.1 type II protein arginine methyltransferase [Malassezia vespertilionis]
MATTEQSAALPSVHVPVSLFISGDALAHTFQRFPGQTHDAALATTQAEIGTDVPVDAALEAKLKNPGVTPVQSCQMLATAGKYDNIVLELTNAQWRERWERLCLLQSLESEPDRSFGAPELPRSSSRAVLFSGPAPSELLRTEAEQWRADPHFQRAELNVTHLDEPRSVTLMLSQWLELDSPDEGVRFDSELALRQEFQYAAYLGVQHVVLPAPSSSPDRRPFLADYARAVRDCLAGIAGAASATGPTMKVSVRMPVSSPHILATMLMRQATRTPNGAHAMPAAAYLRTNDNWAWETWEALQNFTGYNAQLHVALDLSMPLPPSASMQRWTAEPVSMLWLPSSSFLANAKGYPVLSKSAQGLIRRLLRRKPTVVLSDITTPPPQHTRGGPTAYLQYIRHLEHTLPEPDATEAFAQGYGDLLQVPLQPMSENLGGSTYDVFESDPVKYDLYEEAIYQALVDRASLGTTTQIWVVGAGHGMLVARSLAAAERASRAVHVTALEKNPGACIGLQDRQLIEWGDQVTVVQGDMRTLPPPSGSARADIVLSELLGSLGDNELAPECLDGAMRFLKPNGISIPSAYTAHIAPITAPKLYAKLHNATQAAQPHAQPGVGMGELSARKGFDTPYVVLLQSSNLLSSTQKDAALPRIQPCWRFEHGPLEDSGLVCAPNGLPCTDGHNMRTSVNTFFVSHAGVCHGLVGYFEAQLYKDITLSTVPDDARKTPDMVSWFPTFFPFREPLYVPPHAEIQVHLWRLTDKDKVWYEWCAEVFLLTTSPALAAQVTGADSILFSPAPDHSVFSNAAHTPMVPGAARFGDGNVGLGLGLSPNATPTRVQHITNVLDASPNVTLDSVTSPSMPAPHIAAERLARIKTGETPLMNAGARGSWLTIGT